MSDGDVAATGMTRLRLAVLAVGYAVLGVAAGAVFDDVLWALVLAPLVPVVLVGVVAGRSAALRVVAAVMGVFAATGLAVASIGGDGGDAVAAFGAGVRRILSTEWPSPRTADLVGVVAAGLAIAAALSALLTTWRRWHLLPLLPVVVAYTAIVGLAAPAGVQPAVLVVECVAAAVFATLRNDGSIRERWLLLRGERRLVPLLATAAFLVIALSVPISFATRADPRSAEPAAQTAAVLDPIEATIALRAIEPPIPLHGIEPNDTNGTALPTRWRTSALTTYDGRRWTPGLTLRPIGGTLGPVTGETVDVTVSVLDGDLLLVPLPGDPVRISTAVETDPERTVVRLVERPDEGETYDLVANVAPESLGSTDGEIAVRPVDETVAGLTSFAESMGGGGTALDQLASIEQTMRDDFVLDSDAPGGGLQRVLIDRFLRDTERGNVEQFATGFVLLARSLGVDARVATGFVTTPAGADGSITLTSSDALIWPEVALADGTWVAFDPAPEFEASDAVAPPPEPQVQTPAAPQPPIDRPPEPAGDPSNADDAADDDAADTSSTVTRWIVRSVTILGTIAMPLLFGAAVILGIKYLRRRRRLHASEPHERIRGAWATATDDLVDAGLTIRRSTTDLEIAVTGEALAPRARRELHRLADLSGAATFGSPSRPDLLSQDAATCLEVIDAAIVRERTRWQRLRWRLSLRSLRPATRSPVAS